MLVEFFLLYIYCGQDCMRVSTTASKQQAVNISCFIQWQQQIREGTKPKPYLDTFMLISNHTLFYINTAKIGGGRIFPFYKYDCCSQKLSRKSKFGVV